MSKNNKFIIFIVEGSTDRESLALVLSRIFEKYNIHFKIVDGDITSDKNKTNFNIKNKLGKLIKEVQSNYHLKLTDIYKVIQVVDMDGVY